MGASRLRLYLGWEPKDNPMFSLLPLLLANPAHAAEAPLPSPQSPAPTTVAYGPQAEPGYTPGQAS